MKIQDFPSGGAAKNFISGFNRWTVGQIIEPHPMSDPMSDDGRTSSREVDAFYKERLLAHTVCVFHFPNYISYINKYMYLSLSEKRNIRKRKKCR